MPIFRINSLINWVGEANRLLPKLHSKELTGLVVNPVLIPFEIKPLILQFEVELRTKELVSDILDAYGWETERELMIQMQNDDDLEEEVGEMLRENEEVMEEVTKLREAPEEEIQHFYGVFDGSGLEFFCPADYWESDDIQIRTGGHLWWLQWCKNGGRNGSSQPFSAWMTPTDATWITSSEKSDGKVRSLEEDKAHKEKTSTFIMWLMNQKMPNTYPCAEWLWPWSQHMEYLARKAKSDAIESGYSEGEEGYREQVNENYSGLMSSYASSRQAMKGLLRVDFDFY